MQEGRAMDLSGLFTYVAILSVATERVTEFLKRVPGVSDYLSTPKQGNDENWRVMAVYGLSISNVTRVSTNSG